MKRIFMVAAVCTAAIACNRNALPSATPVTNAEIQNEQGKTILAGHCSISILQTGTYKEWFDKSFNNYAVDTATIHLMQPYLADKTVEIFLGSWCGDSKREVPRIIKVLHAAHFDTANLRLIFVDNSPKAYKQSPQHEEAGKTIHHVPTIIVYNHDKEIGRIIESPRLSLEKDMLAIVLHQPYAPNYKSIAWWVKNVNGRGSALNDEKLAAIAHDIKPVCERMSEYNTYGYVLLAQKNYIEALNVFKLNTLLFPAIPGTYDSLGEAYMQAGNNAEAKKNYEKVLQLKPGDENAVKMLAQLN